MEGPSVTAGCWTPQSPALEAPCLLAPAAHLVPFGGAAQWPPLRQIHSDHEGGVQQHQPGLPQVGRWGTRHRPSELQLHHSARTATASWE